MKAYSFGNHIYELRIRAGLTQSELGDLLGISDKSVSKWENGKSKPQVSILVKLADALGVTVDELLSCSKPNHGDGKGIPLRKKERWDKVYQDICEKYESEYSLGNDGSDNAVRPYYGDGIRRKSLLKLLIVSEGESDLSKMLRSCINADILTQEEALRCDISKYDCYAVLGGKNENGTVIDIRLRDRLEKECDNGKKVFCEFVNSFRYIYSESPLRTSHHRLVAVNSETGLEIGDILDDENNDYMKPCCFMPGTVQLLVYHDYVMAHSKADASLCDAKIGNAAMWKVGDNLLMTAFRLCDFNKARFAPRKNWERLVKYICKWLTFTTPVMPSPLCTYKTDISDDDFPSASDSALSDGISMLGRLLIDGGKGGIAEGLKHNIRPDGTQLFARVVRTDCIGEASGAFGFFAGIYGDARAEEISKNLEELLFERMMIKGGWFDGMMRWTDTTWGVCYQDDAARAILPILYRNDLLGTKDRLDEICRLCDFLVSTTSKDGTRLSRTDCINFKSAQNFEALKSADEGYPSAHYNAYYHAMLLLTYRLTGKKTYLSVARKGLETLMGLYPDTKREQSETEELCRLVLPLALLYGVTGKENHKAMLYRVVNDLAKHEHPFGGYKEWDTDYKANCSRGSNSESSLLSANGDPVADLMYSLNWLPIGFAYAYKETGDSLFYDKWKRICTFFLKTQIHCPGEITDGAWCRAFDMDAVEVYGVPHDAGWGPNAVESGWTVSEILMGIMIMKYIKRKEML